MANRQLLAAVVATAMTVTLIAIVTTDVQTYQAVELAPQGSGWTNLENDYFHPAHGIAITDKLRKKFYSEHKHPETKLHKSWQGWEDNYFQPIKNPTEADRLMHFQQAGSAHPASPMEKKFQAKARSWQGWEDTEFGHTQSQIASARLPVVHHKPLKGARTNKKKLSPQDLVDAIADKSWVSSAETDEAPRPKPVRFTDTLK